MANDFYGELGVSRSASADEIKKAYRKLAAKLHPDKNPGDKKIETRFKAVNRAYQVLSDPKKKALYDEFGEDALREGFDADAAREYAEMRTRGGRRAGGNPYGGGSFRVEDIFGGGGGRGGNGLGDLFGDLFQNVRGAQRGPGPKGPDIASEVTVGFLEALRGAELNLTLQNGSEPITVRIPPGADDGDRLRVPGQGAPGAFGGGTPGDLVLAIHVRPHPWFERRGIDLYLDLPITVGEAFRGAKVQIPTPEGNVTLTVPKHAQSGQVLRLKGKGVRRKKDVGDLFVRFLVKLPDSDSRDVEQAINELERHIKKDVREGIGL